ncbi:MAG: hypothetical protein V5A47_01245 [Bacteroidales bacterium]|nr:hypothetical protein [Bacteroidales bacterium]
MIKNLGNILLSMIVLCATTGLAVNKHYSNGELFSASLYLNPEICCQNEDFCYYCHEETEVFKITDFFRNSSKQNLNTDHIDPIRKTDVSQMFYPVSPIFKNITHKLKHPRNNYSITKFLQVFIL